MFRYFHFLCFFVVSVSTLRSDVIYSTFGPGQSFSNNELDISGTNSSAGGYQAVAQMFQPSEAATLTTISVPLSFFSGVNSFKIAIALDESGQPGTTLESFAVLNVPSFPGAVEDVVSTMTPVLSSASTYWLEVVPGDLTTSGGWFSRDPFPNYGSVNFAVNHGSGWSINGPTGPQAFEIDGTAISAASVPEPGSLLLIATTSALLISKLRRAAR